MRIGEMARLTGVSSSALRYYEREGLLPPPARTAKKRTYDTRIIGRIRIILLARSAGFSIAETRIFIGNDPTGTIPSSRWRSLANRKIQEMDGVIAKAEQMKRLLRSGFNCSCETLEDCERLLLARQRPARRDRQGSSARSPRSSSKVRCGATELRIAGKTSDAITKIFRSSG